MKPIKSLLIALFVGTCVAASAQPEQHMVQRTAAQEKSALEKIARQMTDRMRNDLQLTDPQYKKIYKLNLSWVKQQSSSSGPAQPAARIGNGMSDHGGPMGGGMGGHGGGMGGHGGPMGGSMGGSMGGPNSSTGSDMDRPTNGIDDDQPRKGGTKSFASEESASDAQELEQRIARREKAFSKVLTPEQFKKWQAAERQQRMERFVRMMQQGGTNE